MADGKITIGTKIDEMGASRGIKGLEGKLKGMLGVAQSVGTGIGAALSAGFVAMGAAAVKSSMDFSGGVKIMQQQLGVTKEEATELTEVANGIYKRGFGESLEQTSTALTDVKKNFGDLVSEADLGDVTTQAMTLADVMGEDVNWVSRAGTTLMKEFGSSSTEAFDLIAWGSQNGLNFSQELLDNISEYGPLFGDMGYSADEYFKLMQKGAEEGAYNMDYVNDVMKEFQIRVQDGSKTTADAMGNMSDKTQDVWKEFQNGEATVKDVNNAVLNELAGMDDKVAANQLGVALYGTKWEDLGADAVTALADVSGEIDGAKGAMDGMVEAQEQSFGQRFQSLIRTAGDSLRPLGDILLDVAEKYLPPIIEKVTEFADWLANANPVVQKIVIALGAFLAVLPLIVAGLATLSIALMGLQLATMGWTLLIVAIVAVVATIVVLIVKYWDEIKEYTIAAFTAIWDGIKAAWDWVKETTSSVLTWLGEFLQATWQWLVDITLAAWNGIKDFFIALWEGIVAIITFYIEAYKLIFSTAWTWIVEITTTVWNGIKDFFIMLWTTIVDWVMMAIEGWKIFFQTSWQWIIDVTTSIWSIISTFFINLWNDIISWVMLAIEGWKIFFQTSWNWIKTVTSTVFNAIKSVITMIWNTIVSVVTTIIDKFKKMVQTAWNWIKSTTSSIFNGIKSLLSSIWNSIVSTTTSIVNRLKSGISSAWNAIKSVTTSVWNGIKNFFSGVWDNILSRAESMKNGFIAVWNGIKSGVIAVINPIISAINTLISGIESMVNAVASGVNSLPSFDIPDWVPGVGGGKFGLPKIGNISLPRVPSLDVGTNFVAQDGLAMIHKGEAVVPAKVNGKYQEDEGGSGSDGGGVHIEQNLTFNSAEPLSPAKIKKKNLEASRQLAMDWRRKK